MRRETKYKTWHESSKIMSIEFTLDDARKHEVDYISGGINLECTGYADINDNEILEGDILKVCNGSINGTPWMDKDYTVVEKKNDGSFSLHNSMWDKEGNNCMNSTRWCEIIGNKYEHKDLLDEQA